MEKEKTSKEFIEAINKSNLKGFQFEEGCGKQRRNYEADENGEPIPCEVLICGKGWLCPECQAKEKININLGNGVGLLCASKENSNQSQQKKKEKHIKNKMEKTLANKIDTKIKTIKTLVGTDNPKCNYKFHRNGCLQDIKEDVKEFIREVYDYIENGKSESEIKDFIKNRAGKELL